MGDTVCASTGNICDIFLMFEHNVDVDNSDKAKALFAKHGRTCRTAVDANGRDLPFITSGGICLYTAQRDESWMSTCTANSGKANLCFCCTPAAPKAPDDCAACDGCLWRGQCRDRTTYRNANPGLCKYNSGTWCAGSSLIQAKPHMLSESKEAESTAVLSTAATCSGTGDWFLGKEGENCDTVCASTGNICDIFLMFEHNVDVDTSDKAKAL